jgi:hypothetical protein
MSGTGGREITTRGVDKQCNFRHAAVLAFVGWYLMVPLCESEDSAKLHADVPLADWVYVDSFDTAKDCRDEALKEEKRHAKDPLEADEYGTWECIATDDPRLK